MKIFIKYLTFDIGRKNFMLTTFILAIASMISAQIIPQSGLILDSVVYNSIPLIPSINSKDESIPSSMSLQKFCPFPKSQGSVASCTGWAIGYGALSISRAYDMCISDRSHITDSIAHSASFIYNQLQKGKNCEEVSLASALQLFAEQGVCLAKTFPNFKTSCDQQPGLEAKKEARKYKPNSKFYRLFNTEDNKSTKLKNVQIQVARGNPVIAGFNKTPGYNSLEGHSNWHSSFADDGGHAMVIIGYDNNKRAFELMNSFGQSWGNNGFIWMSYDYFNLIAQECYVLEYKEVRKGTDAEVSSNFAVHMSANIKLHFLTISDESNREYQIAPMVYQTDKKMFKTVKKTWRAEEDEFKLTIDLPKGRCMYIFSVNSKKRSRLLYSKEQYYQDTTIIFPSDTGRGFHLKEGNETLVALISYEKIDNLDYYLRQFRYQPSEDIIQIVRDVFKGFIIPDCKINYQSENIHFKSKSKIGEGVAVPVFITLFAQ